jgi:hypothetical protein
MSMDGTALPALKSKLLLQCYVVVIVPKHQQPHARLCRHVVPGTVPCIVMPVPFTCPAALECAEYVCVELASL